MDCCFGITGFLQGICDERLWEWVLGECIGVNFGDVVSLGVLDFRRNSASLTRRIGTTWNNICQVSKFAITECGIARVGANDFGSGVSNPINPIIKSERDG